MRHTPERYTDASYSNIKGICWKTLKRRSSAAKTSFWAGKTASLVLCRNEGIAQSQYYPWSKEFLACGGKFKTSN